MFTATSITIGNCTITPTECGAFLFKSKSGVYAYTVCSTPKGMTCNCKGYRDHRTCKHAEILFNMIFVTATDSGSLLHAQYLDLLKERGLGKGSPEQDYKIRLGSLDYVTYSNEHAVWGKYFSRHDGRWLKIEIKKVV